MQAELTLGVGRRDGGVIHTAKVEADVLPGAGLHPGAARGGQAHQGLAVLARLADTHAGGSGDGDGCRRAQHRPRGKHHRGLVDGLHGDLQVRARHALAGLLVVELHPGGGRQVEILRLDGDHRFGRFDFRRADTEQRGENQADDLCQLVAMQAFKGQRRVRMTVRFHDDLQGHGVFPGDQSLLSWLTNP
ncbi:hypothetical protein D3C78_1415900 [compost metagenome]